MRTIRFDETRGEESGSVLVLVVVFIVVLFAFAALSIDLSRVYRQERDLQSATDVAALAAVELLTNQSVSASSVIQQGLAIAQANGISTNEVTASNAGTIQIGTWNTNALTFTANTPQSTWNAVLVPAKRNVSLLFGKLIGMGQMTPHAQSVAMEGGLFGASGIIPFGVTTNELQGLNYGDVIDTSKGAPGNWGKVNLCGINMSDNNNFQTYMLNGVDCSTSTWTVEPTPGPGNAGLSSGFNARLAADPIVIMPIVDAFPNGKSGTVTVEGFVVGKLLSNGGNGNSWNSQIQLLNVTIGGGQIGGITNAPYAQVRVLVQ